VPQTVELRMCRRERCRVTVAEADHGNAREEIEIALAVGIDEPRAFAVGERDVEPRIGGEELRERLRRSSCDHRRAADFCSDAAPGRERRRA